MNDILQSMTSSKPVYGSPCNNCGICCALETCPLGAVVFGITDTECKCPALQISKTENGYIGKCGIAENPEKYGNYILD